MEAKRLEKFQNVLKEELARAISQEIDFPKGVIATVMSVKIYSDLSWAEIFVSVIPEKESEFVLNVLKRKAYFLHQALNEKIRLRRIPRIKFLPYAGVSPQEKIEQILDEISVKESSAE
ncbi:ribosome-binding factor A [Candidatus Shapirobacteria bacterium CG10_big_fil_rev_8_21_14_0_10_38_14]|uniref:Ribosome-binding factor A n=1 Tax=Candidatus Shapirobacteria bacterium CG10_big_fil_rev_8_21_14_0_10_38_14 TaxID=1974483 RepID=A0A2M8L5Y8_9BACT|nr:MAG: ribosome-binding factor A [Candidatus Shapirobacteria bacterium CG10_big_fil_rev_8_21_14_0_10_38_14]